MFSQIELAKRRLFSGEGLQVANIGLSLGSDRDATAEQLAEQVNRALSQLEAGDYEVVEHFED